MQVAHNLVKELIKYLRKSDTRLTTLQRISVVMVSYHSFSETHNPVQLLTSLNWLSRNIISANILPFYCACVLLKLVF